MKYFLGIQIKNGTLYPKPSKISIKRKVIKLTEADLIIDS